MAVVNEVISLNLLQKRTYYETYKPKLAISMEKMTLQIWFNACNQQFNTCLLEKEKSWSRVLHTRISKFTDYKGICNNMFALMVLERMI